MSGTRKPTLKWSPQALRDMVRLREFIEPHNPDAARRAAETLKKSASLLLDFPLMGKQLEGRQDRDLIIPFGKRGYVMRYRLHNAEIVILKIWHEREDR
jgi:toxin ParE1/3/4